MTDPRAPAPADDIPVAWHCRSSFSGEEHITTLRNAMEHFEAKDWVITPLYRRAATTSDSDRAREARWNPKDRHLTLDEQAVLHRALRAGATKVTPIGPDGTWLAPEARWNPPDPSTSWRSGGAPKPEKRDTDNFEVPDPSEAALRTSFDSEGVPHYVGEKSVEDKLAMLRESIAPPDPSEALRAAMETGSQVPSEAVAALHEIPDGYWLAPNELTQPMLAAAGFIAEDNSNRKRWEMFKKHAPKVECAGHANAKAERAAVTPEMIENRKRWEMFKKHAPKVERATEAEPSGQFDVSDMVQCSATRGTVRAWLRESYLAGHASGYAKAIEECTKLLEEVLGDGHELTITIRALAAPADAGKGG